MIVLGWASATLLALVGALHVVWMVTPWPLRTPEEFARKVVGVELTELPSRPLTALVAAMLFAAAYLILARVGAVAMIVPEWMVVAGAAGVALVLLARAAQGFLTSPRRDTEFASLDLRVYSPLCLVLGGLCAVAALSPTG